MASRKQEFYMQIKAMLDKQTLKDDAKELQDLLSATPISFDAPEFEENVRKVVQKLSKETMGMLMHGLNESLGLVKFDVEKMIEMPNEDMWREMGKAAAQGFAGAFNQGMSGINEGQFKDILTVVNQISEAVSNISSKGASKAVKSIQEIDEALARQKDSLADIEGALQPQDNAEKADVKKYYESYQKAVNNKSPWEVQYKWLVKFISAYEGYRANAEKPTVKTEWTELYDKRYGANKDRRNMLQNILNRNAGQALVGYTKEPFALESTLQEIKGILQGGLKVNADNNNSQQPKPKQSTSRHKTKEYTAYRTVTPPNASGKSRQDAMEDFAATYWSTSRDLVESYADVYSKENSIIIGTIKPTNPLIIDAKGVMWDEFDKMPTLQALFPELSKVIEENTTGSTIDGMPVQKYINEQAKQAGFDAVIMKNVQDNFDAWIDGDIPTGTTIAALNDDIVTLSGSLKEITKQDEPGDIKEFSKEQTNIPEYYEHTQSTTEQRIAKLQEQQTLYEQWYRSTVDRLQTDTENNNVIKMLDDQYDSAMNNIRTEIERLSTNTITESESALKRYESTQEETASINIDVGELQAAIDKLAELVNKMPEVVPAENPANETTTAINGTVDVISPAETNQIAQEATLKQILQALQSADADDSNSPEPDTQQNDGQKIRTAIMQELAKYGTLEDALKAGGKRIQFDGSEVHFGSFVSDYLDEFLGQSFNRDIYADLWKEARETFYKFEPVELTKEDAINIIREKVPDNILEGWFRKGDSAYKTQLESITMSDDEIRNAALNIMWSNFKEFSGKDIGFKEFLNSEIPVYRGKNSEKYVDGDELLAFSFDENMAKKFGNHILETLIKPIETLGAFQTTAEAETLVYRKPLEGRAEYQQWHNKMTGIDDGPDPAAIDLIYKEIDAEKQLAEARKAAAEAERQQEINNYISKYGSATTEEKKLVNDLTGLWQESYRLSKLEDDESGRAFDQVVAKRKEVSEKLKAANRELYEALHGSVLKGDVEHIKPIDVTSAEEAHEAARENVLRLRKQLEIAKEDAEEAYQKMQTYGYMDGSTRPAEIGRARATLLKNGRNTKIPNLLRDGYMPEEVDGKYRMTSKEGTFASVTKTEADYAYHLLAMLELIYKKKEGEILTLGEIGDGLDSIWMARGNAVQEARTRVENIQAKLEAAEKAEEDAYDNMAEAHNVYARQQQGDVSETETENNQKKIDSYEELCTVLARYFELKSQLRRLDLDYADGQQAEKVNPPLHAEMENIQDRLENSQLDSHDLTVFNTLMDASNADEALSKIAKALGIDIPQAAQVSENAVNNLNEELHESQRLENSDNTQAEINAEAAAIANKTQRQEEYNAAIAAEPDVIPDNTTTAVIPANINEQEETKDMNTLLAAVQAVTEAVKLKTRAFWTEKTAVDQVIAGEIAALSELEGKLGTIKSTLDGLLDNLHSGEVDLAAGLSNVNINVNAAQTGAQTTAVGNVPATENTLLAIKNAVEAINQKTVKGTKVGGSSGRKSTTKSDYRGSPFFADKLKTREMELAKFAQQLSNADRSTEQTQNNIRRLQDLLKQVDSGEKLSVWDQLFRQTKLSDSIDKLQDEPDTKEKVHDYKQLIEFAKKYYQLVERYEKAEEGSERKNVLGRRKNEVEEFLKEGNIDFKTLSLDDPTYNKKLIDARTKHQNNMEDIAAAKADKQAKQAENDANIKALNEEKEQVKKLLALYEKFGEFEALGRLSNDDEIKRKAEENIKAIEEQIEAHKDLLKLTNETETSRAFERGQQKTERSINAAKQQERQAQIREAERVAKELGKLEAKQAVDSDNQELANAIDQYRNMLSAKQQALDLDEKDLDLVRLRAQAEESIALKMRSANEAKREQQKTFNDELRAARKEANVGRAGSVLTSARDTFFGAASISSDFNDENVAKLKQYHTEMQALQKLYTAMNSAKMISDEDKKNLIQQTSLVKNLTKEICALVKEYDELSGDNVASLNAFNTGGSVEEQKRQLIEAVKAATNGKAVIGDFDATTMRLNYTLKDGSHEFTNYQAAIRGTNNEMVSIQGTTKRTETLFESMARKTKEVFAYFGGSSLIYEGVNQIRQGIQYVREIDGALTELKKVTDETEESYDRFLDTASKTADKVGSTISNIVSSTADWARLGYSMEEAAGLAESTSVLLNVSEFSSIEEATSALTSTMQAFGYTASQSMDVVDVMNEVGKTIARR